jgi:hypothetical protein
LKSEVEIMTEVKALFALIVSACLLVAAAPPPLSLASSSGHPAPPATSVVSTAPTWPRVFDRNGAHIIVYQPQLKIWQGYRNLVADTAISIQQNGTNKPILGVISWKANTITDVTTKTVIVRDIEVLSARFPYLDPTQEPALQQKIRQVYPTMTFTIGLERMIASLAKLNAPVHSITADVQPPTIFVSTIPAIVLLVNGKPVLAPIQGSTLEYVVNTNWDLFYDKSDYYLLDGKTWLKAKELTGPWTISTKLPSAMTSLPKDQWDEVLKTIPPAASATANAPKVFFTDKPAELIVSWGQPVFGNVSGADLQYVTNTESNLFRHQPDGQFYVLLSGRWFRAESLSGPWTYAGNHLPADFLRIPKGQSYSSVLISIPGTQAASDAVLLSQVPTTAIVNRAEAASQVKVVYAGEPQFVSIETTTMYYAVNTPNKVIRVGDAYYLCSTGIWFLSSTPNGPWTTADYVPPVVYTIPPSSPVYNVTYVVVSNPTPTTVEMSYSSGYLGMFVLGAAVGATVVYGTGYYYPPYIYWGPRPIYYPYPYTYGVAAVYNPYTGAYGVGRAVYGPYGSAGTAAWYNPNTGMYGRAVTTQNAYGGHTYAQAYNPWTGTYAATSQGHNQYSQWGSSVVTNGNNWAQAQHVTNANGTAGSFQTSKGSAGAGVSGANGNSGFVAKDANNNNVYAGADGNVYKKDSNGNWSKWDNGSWTPVDPSTGAAQAKSQAQNKAGNNQQQQKTPGANPPTSSSPSGNIGSTNGADSTQRGQRGAGQASPGQSTPTPNQPPAGALGGSSDTMGQLQNDANSRARGDQLEQSGRGAGKVGGATRPPAGGAGARRRP